MGPYQWGGPACQEAKEVTYRLWPPTVDPRSHEKGGGFLSLLQFRKRCMRSAVLVVCAHLQAPQWVECTRSTGTAAAAAAFSGIGKDALGHRVSNLLVLLNRFMECIVLCLQSIFPPNWCS
jgi:hypothetical protein